MIIIEVADQYYKTEFVLPLLNDGATANTKYCKAVRWNWTKKKWAKTSRYISFETFTLISDFKP